LVITGTTGFKIAYTTNGEDPRIFKTGVVNPNAIEQDIPVKIILTDTTLIKARQIKTTGLAITWGPIDQIIVNVNRGCVLCGKLLITEVHYHHKKDVILGNGSSPDGSFIEIKNIGNSPVVLTGSRIEGLRYTFPPLILGGNQFWVIARFYEDFKKIYGKYPNDTFTGRMNRARGALLPKPGDEFSIIDSVGNLVFKFSYKCSLPWTELPDGYGYSLVANAKDYKTIIDSTKDRSLYYRYSTKLNGSPWSDDPEPDWSLRNIKIQFSYTSFENNFVQFWNPSDTAIDLSGWAIYCKGNIISKIPKGAIIKPNDYYTQKGVKGLIQDSKILLFKLDIQFNAFTGDFIEFDSAAMDLALD